MFISKHILVGLILFLPAIGHAQRVVDVERDNVDAVSLFVAVAGQPISSVKYVKVVEGTPYFNSVWMRGSVMLNDSNEYINLLLRIDLLGNNVEYIDKKGKQLTATSAIREVKLVDSLTGKTNHFIHSTTLEVVNAPAGWYQVLATGKITLYKKIHKEVIESRPYGSATTEQRISSINQYFFLTDNRLTRIKKFKEFPALLPSKKAELAKLIDNNKLSGKTDQDYIDIVELYNR